MGGKIVRTIGIARARLKIGMMNLRLQHASPGSARADSAGRLSALTGGVRVSCKRPARRKAVPDRGPTLARAPQPLAQQSRVLFYGPPTLAFLRFLALLPTMLSTRPVAALMSALSKFRFIGSRSRSCSWVRVVG